MSQFSDLIVDIEVMDKRETGGNSTVMERECLKKILMRLKDKLKIVELTTDASTTIIKMIRDLKG